MMYEIASNERLTGDIYRLRLNGAHEFARPGQFANIALPGFYLRRPLSVCDWDGDGFTVLYKTVGEGTRALARATGALDALTGLGNGFDTARGFSRPLLVGGGMGAAPLYALAKKLIALGARPLVALGFASKSEMVLAGEFRALGLEPALATADGSAGAAGFVTDVLPGGADGFYACGPEPMLEAVCARLALIGQVSLEARMACGFGACMGCSRMFKTGPKRVCADGPVFDKEDMIWPTRA